MKKISISENINIGVAIIGEFRHEAGNQWRHRRNKKRRRSSVNQAKRLSLAAAEKYRKLAQYAKAIFSMRRQ